MQARAEFDGCHTVKKLRSGPIADSYHAIQEPLGRPVLIKALSSSILASSPFAARLEREARLLAQLHHPNILHLYDFVRRGDRMWLVLEYVEGFTLSEILEKKPKVSQAAAVAIGLKLARALDHAHQRNVVHRDVQPQNVLISKSAEVKLINFAVAVDDRLQTAPELLEGASGTGGPAYMSPEQILGERADPRSDLFSLGVVLYELLSGVQPFAEPSSQSTTQRIRHAAPTPLTRLVPGLLPALERHVHRCLEKMAADRFLSAGELVAALESLKEELGVSESAAIGALLVENHLVDQAPASSREVPPPVTAAPRHTSLRSAVQGFLLAFGLIVAGGALIQAFGYPQVPTRYGKGQGQPLELLPSEPAHLRVVADPWAHVSIDGQHVDTTPFARPIPLSAGTHYVRLEHPNAPVERRTLRLSAGETILLDVKMNVPRRRLPPAPSAALAPEDAGRDANWSP